jgi:hypothetical protein
LAIVDRNQSRLRYGAGIGVGNGRLFRPHLLYDGTAQLRRLRHIVPCRKDRCVHGRDEHLAGHAMVLRVPSYMLVPQIDLEREIEPRRGERRGSGQVLKLAIRSSLPITHQIASGFGRRHPMPPYRDPFPLLSNGWVECCFGVFLAIEGLRSIGMRGGDHLLVLQQGNCRSGEWVPQKRRPGWTLC